MDTTKRFWSKVHKSDSCWEWTACTNELGYGGFNIAGKKYLAHRVAWEIEKGEIPKDVCVLHRCDNPRCVNPGHLFLGDRAMNNEDKRRKGRLVNPLANKLKARTHCKNGHEFTPQNTRNYGRGRRCVACVHNWNRLYASRRVSQ